MKMNPQAPKIVVELNMNGDLSVDARIRELFETVRPCVRRENELHRAIHLSMTDEGLNKINQRTDVKLIGGEDFNIELLPWRAPILLISGYYVPLVKFYEIN